MTKLSKPEAEAALSDALGAYGFNHDNPLILPERIYDALAETGADMTGAVRQQPLPYFVSRLPSAGSDQR
jgi:hypothetical protein